MSTNTTAHEHAERAISEMHRKLEEGASLRDAYIVACDYVEDFSGDMYREAAEIFEDHPLAKAGWDTL